MLPTPGGGEVWRSTTVLSILQNEKYKGAELLQKKFTTEFLTKKQKIYEGEDPQYYVENSHPAIIDPQLWELTQIEIDRRKAIGKSYSGNGVFSARLICAECGQLFTKRSWQNKESGARIVWFCKNKYKHGKTCDSPLILEDTLREKFVEAIN